MPRIKLPDEPWNLTAGWEPLDYHPAQAGFFHWQGRYGLAHAGRRSGKTELAIRWLIKEAMSLPFEDGWCVFAGPTQAQAKRIAWRKLKKLVPKWAVARIYEGELTIELITGVQIQVLGLDVPERIEGRILDRIVLDEYGNMKKKTWDAHVGPALDTRGREGKARFIGVPEGRNHYYHLHQFASQLDNTEWGSWGWLSSDILPEETIRSAKARLDPRTYRQEYEGSFESFGGRAYYEYQPEIHAAERISQWYNPNQDLLLCFDFNRAPGICAYAQEMEYQGDRCELVAATFTGFFGEVWIPQDSNTRLVCNRIKKDHGKTHKGRVLCFGDATGGAGGSAKVEGSDWDLIRKYLKPVFGDRLRFRVKDANPRERVRVNSFNSRLRTADGIVHCLIDPVKAPQMCADLDEVVTVEGGSGEINKDADEMRTHISDGGGYYIEYKFPVNEAVHVSRQYS